jgi:protein-disulfide isomerase
LAWTLLAASVAIAQAPSGAPSSPPVAVVSGEPITEAELESLIQAQMRQLRQQEYAAKSQALESLIDQKLAAAEAKKRGLPLAEMLAQEIDAKVAPVTDPEIESFYEGQKASINQPLETVKEQIRQLLRESRAQQARQTFYASLRANADVVVNLDAPRTEVSPDPLRQRGNPKAPVTIVEFSDFQCPFCQRAAPVIRSVIDKYGDQVSFSYRDFPLRGAHSQAQMAAEASRCAADQGKFWEYHDRLFSVSGDFSKDKLVEHSILLELNSFQFQECLDSGRHSAGVEKDLQDGTQAGVNGTPAFFINGILVSGAMPASAFEKTIDRELAARKEAAAAR